LPQRQASHLSDHVMAIAFQLIVSSWALLRKGVGDDPQRLEALTNTDELTRANGERRHVDDLAVDGDMLVQHELTRSPAGGCNSEAVHEVIQTALQHLQQDLAGNALLSRSVDEHLRKLALEQSVDVLGLLLFRELYRVLRLLAFPAPTVLPRRIALFLQRLILAHDGLVKTP